MEGMKLTQKNEYRKDFVMWEKERNITQMNLRFV